MSYTTPKYAISLLAAAFLLPYSAAQGTAATAALQAQAISASTSAPDVGEEQFRIGPDDVLAISVWKEPDITRTVPVRADGKISLPLIGELQAAGRIPRTLEAEIRERLKSYIAEPEVTVIVQESRSRTFNILGEVVRPGSYALTRPVTVLDAIAMAGGFRDFAKRKSIYVLRTQPEGGQQRIPFNYKEATSGTKPEVNVLLHPRDTVVVP